MSDIGLLERAAKVIDPQYAWHPGCGDALHLTAPDATAIYWNPLADDGDALRLAVKLQLTICNEHVAAGVVYRICGENFVGPEERSGASADAEVIAWDYAATRRAIVRAAAEFGLNQ
jgi:hypothetical protein